MKKLAILLLSVLLCAVVCFPVFADMGGPEMIGYTAVVKQAVDYYNWEYDEATSKSYFKKSGTIPAGTELTISNEYEESGEMYGYFYDAPALDGEGGYVRLADLHKDADSSPAQVTGYKQNFTVHLRVTEPKGVRMYAGPSGTYPIVDTIPVGTELAVNTLDQDGYETGAWMYVSYGGKTGWIRCWLYDSTSCPAAELLPEGTEGTLWVVKDNAVLVDRDGNKLVTVPKGEKLTFTAFNRTAHTISYYATYQEKTGVFDVNDDGFNNVVASNMNDHSAYRDMKVRQAFLTGLYAYPDDRLPTGTVRFSKGETIPADFLYYAEPLPEYRGGVEWVHVEKDGKSGWIKIDNTKLEERDWENNPALSELPDWYNPLDTTTSEEIKIPVPAATTATTAASVTTTAPALIAAAPEAQVTEERTSEETTDALNYAQFERTEETTDTFTPPAMPKRPMPSAAIIAICVGAAALLSLTALVTLRLIHRKKGSEES